MQGGEAVNRRHLVGRQKPGAADTEQVGCDQDEEFKVILSLFFP